MIKKLLVANRGEIAVRIIRACRTLGISPCVIYSQEDKHSLHVRHADESYFLGTGSIHETYMNKEKIIEAAQKLEADALHPGYSFLADDPDFAQQIEKVGIKWIGPSPTTLLILHSKLQTRNYIRKLGFKVVAGSEEPITNLESAKKLCEDIGYPVILKPSYGSGGLGIQVVTREEKLETAIKQSQAIAASAFGKDELYIEKYISNSKLFELGFLVDENGAIIYLPEREITIQHNHQKLIGESPSTFLSENERNQLSEFLREFAKQANFVNLGNMEMHYKEGLGFLFDEINPHIQLEHPVTELVTGIDVVAEQISIADGKPLHAPQTEIKAHGHAFGMRINAEDPIKNFQPVSGVVKELEVPGGPWIRFDTHIYRGYQIPSQYDTYLGQLLVWGNTRIIAINRAAAGLRELTIAGVPTTISFHRHLTKDPKFRAGTFTSNFMEKTPILLSMEEEFRAVIAALVFIHKETSKVTLPPLSKSRWRDIARSEATRRM